MNNIVQSYDASGNAVYPVTHLRAVRDSSGTTLESMMQDVTEMAVGYYECSTPGSTAAKTITIDSSVSLSTKILCKVKFVEKNTANNATMNINNTGAKALYYNGVRAAANNSWYPNEVVDIYYDGTNYQAKSCADTLEYDVSLHQTHEITEITTTTRTLVFNGNVVSSWESETPVSDSSVEGYTRSETNTGQDVDSTTVDGPNATYDSTANKTNVVYVTTHTYTHVTNNYTFQEAVNAVPESYRHGGLKLRFISNSGSGQSSDNKYVQWRLILSTFTSSQFANPNNWQGVDDRIVADSNNLAKSGAVEYITASLIISSGSYLTITENDGGSYTITFPSSYYISFGKSLVQGITTSLTFTPFSGQNVTKIVYNLNTGEIEDVKRNAKLTAEQVFLFAVNKSNKRATLPIDQYRFASGDDSFSQFSNDIKSLKNINTAEGVKDVAFTMTSGIYVSKWGTLTENSKFAMSSPISLTEGQVLVVKSLTSGTELSVVAKVNNNEGTITYTPLVIGGKPSGLVYETYKCEESCDVVISTRYENQTYACIFEKGTYFPILEEKIDDLQRIYTEDYTWTSVPTSGHSIVVDCNIPAGNIIAFTFLDYQGEPIKRCLTRIVYADGTSETMYIKKNNFSHLLLEKDCSIISFWIDYNSGTSIVSSSGTFTGCVIKTDALTVDMMDRLDFVETKIYTLPASWTEKIESINTLKGYKFSFLIQTDTHYKLGMSVDYGNSLKYFTKFVGFDFAANLGDIIEGYSDMTKDLYRQSMTEIMSRYIDGICCPFMYAKGNHEGNSMYADTLSDRADGYIYDDEIYGRTTLPAKSIHYGWHGNGRTAYGYMDFEDAGVRVIVLNTNSATNSTYPGLGGFGINTVQKEWFENVALNTQKKIIVMSHIPLVDNIATDGGGHNNTQSMRDLLPILLAFKNNGGTVIGCFCGHIHEDSSVVVDGINHISFGNGYRASAVLVDTENQTIYIKTIGYDNDRTFNYT